MIPIQALADIAVVGYVPLFKGTRGWVTFEKRGGIERGNRLGLKFLSLSSLAFTLPLDKMKYFV